MSDYGHASYAAARAKAMDEGRTAPPFTDCPYPEGSPLARAWHKGAAQASLERVAAGVEIVDPMVAAVEAAMAKRRGVDRSVNQRGDSAS